MQNITLIALGKVQKGFMQDGCSEYIKRLSPLCNFKLIELSDEQLLEKSLNPTLIKKTLDKEADKILESIPKQSFVIALCIDGKQVSSEELSQIFTQKAVDGFSNITFIIGSSHGISDRVKEVSDLRLSFSKMTFPHQLARVMVLEQIYRGFSIIQGSRYHK